jgi:ribosomal protein S18 acetylase RimI-like enzyme
VEGICQLDGSDIADIVDVLCESFHDYPVMRFVLGDGTPDYDAQLRTLIAFFTAARTLRGEPMIGIRSGADLAATVLVSRTSAAPSPEELAVVREATWAELGDAARLRYEAFGSACAPFIPPEPHLHINMIGVRRGSQGRGLGGMMLDHVAEMSRSDPGSSGISLTTEDPANVSLYEAFGYKVVGHAVVGPDLESWSFFRPDSAPNLPAE